MSEEENIIYRVLFHQDGKIFEVYSRYISEESLVGFLEVDELVLSESRSTILVDPNEEKLRQEFKGVQRSYIPIHLILRIDEVLKEGLCAVTDASEKATNISQFPGKQVRRKSHEDNTE
jgi:hypothetical protein